jgi:molybdenum cofactor biosynthesis enzyme MoaA
MTVYYAVLFLLQIEMELKRLEFTLTRKCNSRCIHCQADASPLRKGVMQVKDAYNYLAEATAVSDLESFMIFGGEPMLYPKRAIAIHESQPVQDTKDRHDNKRSLGQKQGNS